MPFTYIWPDKFPKPEAGMVVTVPFGKRRLRGVVIGKAKTIGNAKPVATLLCKTPVLSAREICLAVWLRDTYFVPLSSTYFTLLPPSFRPQNMVLKSILKDTAAQPPILTAEQRQVLKGIKRGENLILGVTGSGKTEIYIQKAEEILHTGGQVLILVPEISLTPQALNWFQKRLPVKVFSFNSEISTAAKSAVWWGVKKGDIKIVVGSRSASLLPFINLKLIVIDEEQDGSYIQEQAPFYSTVSLAQHFAKTNPDLTVIYGSATPSLETYARAFKGSIKLHRLTQRFGGTIPETVIVDMKGESHLLSACLQEEITRTLKLKRQAVLFLDRRGTMGVITCTACGEPYMCSRCDVPLTYHRETEKLICHHCGLKKMPPKRCLKCGSNIFYGKRYGTERLEREIKALWPRAKIIRYDRDTVRQSSADILYNKFRSFKADILVGTRMVTKGWDIPGVDLVGVIDADLSLFFPDYGAAEGSFSMLLQVAGRAGRRRPGKVVIQTRAPGHPVIEAVTKQDYESFAKKELFIRKKEQFVPFVEIVRILIKHKTEAKAEEIGNSILKRLQLFAADIEILGPAPCFFGKLVSRYRYQVILKIKKWPEGLADILRQIQKEKGLTVQRNPKDLL